MALAACAGSPTSPDVVVEPIAIESVSVAVLESSPPQASAHVQGFIGDGCSDLKSVEQQRTGEVVTVTILRQRQQDAICTQIAKLYDEVIRLEGTFPPGRYVLRVNDTETVFTTE
jgi:hypothetical protein